MSERTIDPVSQAIGALQSDVRTVLTNQTQRDNIDADFRREMRSALGGMATIPTSIAALTTLCAENKTAVGVASDRITALEKRHDRVRNILTGALIVLSGVWGLTILVINKAPDWLRLYHP